MKFALYFVIPVVTAAITVSAQAPKTQPAPAPKAFSVVEATIPEMRALAEAEARDRERSDGRIRGPLHGIPRTSCSRWFIDPGRRRD